MQDYLQYTNLLGEIFKKYVPKRAYYGSWAISAAAISVSIFDKVRQTHKKNGELECPGKVPNCSGCRVNANKRLWREFKDQTVIHTVPTFGFLPLYASFATKLHPVAGLITTPFMVCKLDNFMVDIINVNRSTRSTNIEPHIQNGDPQLPYKWAQSNYY